MKRILTLFAAVCALASCSHDEVVTPNIPTEKPTYYATFVDTEGESRTYLDENLKLLWHNDDRISLFATTYNEEYAFADPTGSNSGAFNAVVKDSYVTGNAISTTYAVYPYNASNAISNSEVLTIHFPAEQTYTENSFGRGANTMVAAAQSSTSKLLPFRNAGGYLMLKLYGENKTVKSIELKGNNEEVISGAATAEAKYGYLPSITMGNEGGKTITLTCQEAVTLGASEAEATVFWLVVPPITFEEGFTITVSDENGDTFTQSTSKEVVIERNEIKSMSALNPTFEGTTEDPEVTIPNNEIHYTATAQVTPNRTDVFGATYLADQSTYDSETQKGVLKFDSDVTKIGDDAFLRCSLTSITIPKTVTIVGESAFHFSSLNSIIIPEGVTTIGKSAFYGCKSLISITLPNSITIIEDQAFIGCSSISSITIPDKVTTIRSSIFYGCSKLQEFNGKFATSDKRCLVNDGILYAVALAGLTSYTIPKSVSNIADWYVFRLCEIESLTLSANMNIIGDELRSHMYLKKIIISKGTTEIGERAFWCCESLMSVIIPESVTNIGAWAFGNCSSLSSIYCKPTTPPTLGGELGSNASERIIYVPASDDDSIITAYKEAWSDYADAIEEYDFSAEK